MTDLEQALLLASIDMAGAALCRALAPGASRADGRGLGPCPGARL